MPRKICKPEEIVAKPRQAEQSAVSGALQPPAARLRPSCIFATRAVAGGKLELIRQFHEKYEPDRWRDARSRICNPVMPVIFTHCRRWAVVTVFGQ